VQLSKGRAAPHLKLRRLIAHLMGETPGGSTAKSRSKKK
jgi:hypothetical protein